MRQIPPPRFHRQMSQQHGYHDDGWPWQQQEGGGFLPDITQSFQEADGEEIRRAQQQNFSGEGIFWTFVTYSNFFNMF